MIRQRAQLTGQIDALGADSELHARMEQQLQTPLDADVLAAQADSPQAAREVCLVRAAIVDDQNAMERAWMAQLAASLGIDAELADALERQAAAG